MRRLIIIAILFTFIVPVYSQANKEMTAFEKGVELYNKDNFTEALNTWIALADSGYTSPDLYYNIGNAGFKTGNMPLAILYYERALLSKPFNEDIRYNLEIANSYIVDDFNTIPELFLVRWFRMVSLIFTTNQWVVISASSFVLTLLLLLLYLFTYKYGIKRFALILAALFLLISISTISLSLENRSLTTRKLSAIIFAPATTGKSSPGTGGKDLFMIHEGTKVKVEDEVGEWMKVRLSDGNVGWIPSTDAEKI